MFAIIVLLILAALVGVVTWLLVQRYGNSGSNDTASGNDPNNGNNSQGSNNNGMQNPGSPGSSTPDPGSSPQNPGPPGSSPPGYTPPDYNYESPDPTSGDSGDDDGGANDPRVSCTSHQTCGSNQLCCADFCTDTVKNYVGTRKCPERCRGHMTWPMGTCGLEWNKTIAWGCKECNSQRRDEDWCKDCVADTLTAERPADTRYEYACDDGWSVDNSLIWSDSRKCYQAEDAEKERGSCAWWGPLGCPEGWTERWWGCSKDGQTMAKIPICEIYSYNDVCPEGWSSPIAGRCYRRKAANPEGRVERFCPYGWTLHGDKCRGSTTDCPQGYTYTSVQDGTGTPDLLCIRDEQCATNWVKHPLSENHCIKP